MNTPKERELQELLTMHPIPEPPADLADRIKAEIPDDLGAVSGAAQVETLPGPRDAGHRFRWRHLALAASLLVMTGGSFLAYRVLRQSLDETPPATAIADKTEPGDGTSARYREPERAVSADRDTADGRVASKDREARSGEDTAGREDRPAAAPGEQRLAEARRKLEKTTEGLPARQRAAQAPAGVEEEMARPDAGARSELQSQLAEPDDVGATVDTPAFAIPEPPPPSPPPPAPSRPAPHPMAKKVPIPDPVSSRTFRDQVNVTGEAVRVDPDPETVAMMAPPSTGGTTEPNDAPYGDVFFEGYGTNPFIDTEDDARSTFGLDVDTGSYTVLRRYLHDGHLPPADAVRVEELVNYFDYRDPPPEKGDFAIHAEGAPSIYGQGERYYLLRFNLHGREIDDRDRKPADLTFVVDVSASMAQENRLGLVQKALALLLDQLRGDDRLALVVYGSRGRVLLEPTSDHGAIRRAIEALQPEGATNAEEGLRLAYELAERHRRRGAIHRVILCSDGVANVGRTSADAILGEIRRHAEQGVELTTVGFGMGNYNDVLMERLADTGNGRYAYVDSLDEARRIFVEGLTGTLQTIAAEARVQVVFNPAVVARYRLLGYENRDIADERFRDDTVDAGEIGAGHTVTALYEIKLHGKLQRRDEIGTLHLRWASIAEREMVETSRRITGADFAPTWEKASPALRLTSLVAELAEILKRSYWAREGDLDDVFRRAQKVSADFEGDREVAEFVSLVGRAADYRRGE